MRKTIAVIEVVGGILSLLSVIFAILQFKIVHLANGFPLLSLLTFFVFGLINLFAGINLWRGKKSGYIASIIIQLVQLIRIQSPYFHYLFYSILGIIISFSKTGMMPFVGFGTSNFISLSPQPVTTLFIGINIIALILLLFLINQCRKIKN